MLMSSFKTCPTDYHYTVWMMIMLMSSFKTCPTDTHYTVWMMIMLMSSFKFSGEKKTVVDIYSVTGDIEVRYNSAFVVAPACC